MGMPKMPSPWVGMGKEGGAPLPLAPSLGASALGMSPDLMKMRGQIATNPITNPQMAQFSLLPKLLGMGK